MVIAYIFFGFLGLVVGSFLNVLTLRVANGEPFLAPRSHCPHCRTLLAWFDNIPLFSFLVLRGRCRSCQTAISWQYPLVELATAIGFIVVAFLHRDLFFGIASLLELGTTPYSLQLTAYSFAAILRDLIAVAGMIALFVFDFRWMIVPDEVSLPLIIVIGFLNLAVGVAWSSLALGIIVGGGFFFALWALSRGQWVGSGDIRLGAFLGAMLGWPTTLLALYVSYLIGGGVATSLLLSGRKKMGRRLPMGAFLMVGGFAALAEKSVFEHWWSTLFFQ